MINFIRKLPAMAVSLNFQSVSSDILLACDQKFEERKGSEAYQNAFNRCLLVFLETFSQGWITRPGNHGDLVNYIGIIKSITFIPLFFLIFRMNQHWLPTIYHIHIGQVLPQLRRHLSNMDHDDVIKWKHFPRNWPFVREIHRSPVNFPHKGQWRGALMFSLIYAWINDWVNNREAGDLRRQHGHYDVIVMIWFKVSGTLTTSEIFQKRN